MLERSRPRNPPLVYHVKKGLTLIGAGSWSVRFAPQVLSQGLEDNRPVLCAVLGHIVKLVLPLVRRAAGVIILANLELQGIAQHAKQENFMEKKVARRKMTVQTARKDFMPQRAAGPV